MIIKFLQLRCMAVSVPAFTTDILHFAEQAYIGDLNISLLCSLECLLKEDILNQMASSPADPFQQQSELPEIHQKVEANETSPRDAQVLHSLPF